MKRKLFGGSGAGESVGGSEHGVRLGVRMEAVLCASGYEVSGVGR